MNVRGSQSRSSIVQVAKFDRKKEWLQEINIDELVKWTSDNFIKKKFQYYFAKPIDLI